MHSHITCIRLLQSCLNLFCTFRMYIFNYTLLQLHFHRSTSRPDCSLQWVQNNAALLVMKKRRDHVTPLLKELLWLTVKFCCQYKIATHAYRQIEGSLPPYLSSSLCTYELSHSLRSSNENCSKFQSESSNHLDNVLSVSWHHLTGSGTRCQPL